ncbi:hypothetical protein ACWDCC_39560 [Streptomyces sp. NPDC001102]
MTADSNQWAPRFAVRLRSVRPSSLRASSRHQPDAAIWTSVAGVALFALVGASAPNHNTLRAPVSWLHLPAMPGTASAAATYAGIVLSCLGTLALVHAHERGWRPKPRALFAAGALAALVVANLTPVGSSDTASYAAYGRIAALGGDPYVTTPARLGSAYAHLVSDAWQHTPSVYGPVATWWQAGAADIGGNLPSLTICVLMLANAAVFLGTGCLLIRTAEDPVRAALLWSANPLLIGVLVAGGHLDTLIACLAVCAVHVDRKTIGRRRDVSVGGLIGVACAVKISAALFGLGLLWPLLRSGAWRPAVRQAAAAVLTLAVLYGVHALTPLSSASQLISSPSPWAVLAHISTKYLGPRATATAIGLIWPVLMLVLARLFHRRFPTGRFDVVTAAFALAFAWIVTAPWSMPWYTALAWALAALVRQVPLTRCLIISTAILALLHNSGGHGWSW